MATQVRYGDRQCRGGETDLLKMELRNEKKNRKGTGKVNAPPH